MPSSALLFVSFCIFNWLFPIRKTQCKAGACIDFAFDGQLERVAVDELHPLHNILNADALSFCFLCQRIAELLQLVRRHPAAIIADAHNKINANFKPDKLTDFLEEICNRSQFHYWLFGHYHDNRIIDEKYVLLYEQMVQIL